ncbi:unnamed protein product [Jaminaea pallidilutea]
MSSRAPAASELELLLDGRDLPATISNAADPLAAYKGLIVSCDALLLDDRVTDDAPGLSQVRNKVDLLMNVGKTYLGKDGKEYYCRPCRPCQTNGRPCPKEKRVRCGHCPGHACNAGGRLCRARDDYGRLKDKLVAEQTWGEPFKAIAIPQGVKYLESRKHKSSERRRHRDDHHHHHHHRHHRRQHHESAEQRAADTSRRQRSSSPPPRAPSRRRGETPPPSDGYGLVAWEFYHDLPRSLRVPLAVDGMSPEYLQSIIDFDEWILRPSIRRQWAEQVANARRLLSRSGSTRHPTR